ncbi:putative membrane protein [[Actinomadura] parvosata subsp. kistnae]|nr:putative membrane protein [Actinomadura parvosata subsp. kistnae]
MPSNPLKLNVGGWTFHGDSRAEFVVDGAPRIEVGHTYIIPLAEENDGRWNPLAPSAILPYDEGRIGIGEGKGIRSDDTSALATAVWGKTAAALTRALETTQAEPAVAKYRNLAPDDRFAAVVKDIEATEPPPGEDTDDHGAEEPQEDPWNGAEDTLEEDPTQGGD